MNYKRSRYKMKFQKAYPPYILEDRYIIDFEMECGIPCAKTVFISRDKQECEKKLKEYRKLEKIQNNNPSEAEEDKTEM